MLTDLSQRWGKGKSRFIPPDDRFQPHLYEVAEIPDDTTAKAFVIANHYSRSFPAARFRFGLYRGGKLVGVAVYSQPMNDASLKCFPGERLDRIELGRLVLLDEVPFNAETWMNARCFDLLRREGLVGVIMFSDPVARLNATGICVFPGHVGQIYQAGNAVYLGRGTGRTLRLLPDGSVFSDRTAQKIRARERGWVHAAEQLQQHGASPLGSNVDSREWLATWLPKITRPLRHPGNHKYAFPLAKKLRKHLPPSLPYPRFAIQ